MELNTILRLDRLALRNFRCFKECDLELHPELTVLVADNARGKTALLHAISTSLDAIVAVLARRKQSHGFDRSDIHLNRGADQRMVPSDVATFKAKGYVDGSELEWSRSLSSRSAKARSTTKDLKAVRTAAKRITNRIGDASSTPTTLPSVVFYGTGRLWNELRLAEGNRWSFSEASSRLYAYLDCLSPSSSFKAFARWYEMTSIALRSATSKAFAPEERPEIALAAVRKAVTVVLEPTGWTTLDWDFPTTDNSEVMPGRGSLVVEHAQHGRLPLSMLSDGVRNMVALVGDLAHRCCRLNPHLGEDAAHLTPGVLLIDEVDMHLHPRWQQLIVELFRKAFPAMQMIFSTHSPQVLSTVSKESIRTINLEDGIGILKTPILQTRGVESADVLARIMLVDPVPQVLEAVWLNDYRALIEDGDLVTSRAMELRQQLTRHFGDAHPLLLDLDRLIRFQAFKRRTPGEAQD